MTLFQHRESRIFKDPKWLQSLSDPPNGKPLCRDSDLETMALFLSDVFRTGQARNLFISGKPGTGKTLCVQYLLNEIRKHAEENNLPLTAVYVNAGKTRTPYYTMLEIVKALGLNIPDRGWQMFRLKQCFEQLLGDKSVVIAVDEVDSIIFKEKEPLVYYLNRQPKTTLILVSNKIGDAASLSNRALSTLRPKLLMLQPYTLEEAKTILAERAESAFYPNAISDKLLDIIAEISSKAEDIRLGFAILLSAGFLAEESGKTMIEAEDVKSSIKSETTIALVQELEALKKKAAAMKKRGR
jgi:cell division control protein 6